MEEQVLAFVPPESLHGIDGGVDAADDEAAETAVTNQPPAMTPTSGLFTPRATSRAKVPADTLSRTLALEEEWSRTEKERLAVQEERLALEKSRFAWEQWSAAERLEVEKQRLVVEQQRLAVEQERLIVEKSMMEIKAQMLGASK